MRDRMEYGKAADRRVVDSASSRTVLSSCYMVIINTKGREKYSRQATGCKDPVEQVRP
jgi:hypothetical protein